MARRSTPQERAIRNYYEHQAAIMLQRLEELATELYLAEGKARARLWERVARAMKHLKVPADRIEHLVQSDNPSLLAHLVKELLGSR
ncbi:MAG: hypothetical protein ACUVUC_09410 [Thermoguttaceae bacterium]